MDKVLDNKTTPIILTPNNPTNVKGMIKRDSTLILTHNGTMW